MPGTIRPIIEEIIINDINLPLDGIGMVIMQPFVELNDSEPFRWKDEKKSAQIQKIIKTLEIANFKSHDCNKTHFTVFPEYSIPGLEGVHAIEQFINQPIWDTGTIIIGGIDGLKKEEYKSLCEENNSNVNQENKPDKVRDGKWINCCVTWIKSLTNGQINKWIQPKLCPSWPEENIIVHDMFEGKAVYIFEIRLHGRAFRLMSLICYDWISCMGSKSGIFAVMDKMNQLDGVIPHGKGLHLCLILQRNKKPNHSSFLTNAFNYFHDREYQFVLRDDSALIFANSAGNCKFGFWDEYGFSSLIFSPRAPYITAGSPPSYAVVTNNLRHSSDLQTCQEALLREHGECVHSFRLHHPMLASPIP